MDGGDPARHHRQSEVQWRWRPRELVEPGGRQDWHETGVETTETGRWPGGDHSVDRARQSSQELVEPGGDHRRGTTRKWIT